MLNLFESVTPLPGTYSKEMNQTYTEIYPKCGSEQCFLQEQDMQPKHPAIRRGTLQNKMPFYKERQVTGTWSQYYSEKRFTTVDTQCYLHFKKMYKCIVVF